MSEKGRSPQLSEQQKMLIKKIYNDRTESAKTLETPSMEGIKETVIEKYSEQAHFIYELLQNADDTKATKVRFILSRSGLIFAHNGTVHFSISDVESEAPDKNKGLLGHINAITSIAQTSKTESEIGKFGIGFKSVFQYTNTPEIYDPPFYFAIDRFIVPEPLSSDHKERKPEENETLFYFPFNSLKKKPADAYTEITERLKDLNHPLLFLKNLKRIGWKNEELQWNYSKDEEIKGKAKIVSSIYNEKAQKNITKFLVFEKEIPSPKNPQKSLRIDIAFRLSPDGKSIEINKQFSPFCFFETHEQSELQFIIQAPFVLNNSREGLKVNDPDNTYLIKNLASLFSESLPAVRDLGFLSIGFFSLIPLPPHVDGPLNMGRYVDFFWKSRAVLTSEEKLMPVYNGGHIQVKNAIIPRGGKDFIDLLGNKQLEDLFGKKGIQWLDTGVSDKNEKLWRLFTDPSYLGIRHIRPEDLGTLVTKTFFEKQSDEWMIKLYSFLLDTKYSDQLRNKPYIRIILPKTENKDDVINHVEPFDSTKKPRAFLPIETANEKHLNDFFPVVKTTIVQDKRAREFLEKIGLTPPDEFAAFNQVILPKYQKQLQPVSDETNKSDVEKIARFVKIKRQDSKNRQQLEDLQTFLQTLPFLFAKNCEGKQMMKSPSSLYLSKEYTEDENLELFFEKNPDIWYLDGMYKNIQDFTILIGFLNISHTPIILTREFEDSHTYTRGFTEDYMMDGLDFFLKNQITLKKTMYLWDLLLLSQRDPKYRIEFSGRFEYANDTGYKGARAGHKIKTTTIYSLLTETAWVPDKQSEFVQPSKVKEFHDDFEQLSKKYPEESERLFTALKFFSDSSNWINQVKSIVKEQSMFNKIKMATELPESVVQEAYKKYIETQKKPGPLPESSLKFANPREELQNFFGRPQRREHTDLPAGGAPVSNPERRREHIAEDIDDTKNREPPASDRFSFSVIKRWDGKNPEVRTFLKMEYGGKCQICSTSFNQRNGDPYFEGVYMISHTKGAWLDRQGSVLCLCPTCSAKMQHGSVIVQDDIVQKILSFKLKSEGGIGDSGIPIILCGKNERLQFSEKHILDLQEILKTTE